METSTIPEPTANDRLGAVIQRAVGAPNPTPEPNVMPVISAPVTAPATGQPVSIAPDAPIEPSPTVEIAPDAPIESIPKNLSEVQPGQKFNPIKDFDTKGLADFSTKNPKFNILDEFQSLPRSEQDNFDIRQKVATALRTSRQDTGVLDGLSVGGIAHTIGTMGKGFWDWLHNFVPTVSNTVLARTPLAGKDAEGIKDVAGQQAAQSAAGLQTMGFGLAKQVLDLSKWAARHSIGTAHDVAPDAKPLWMKPLAEYTPQDDLELLNNEVAARTVMGKIASGEKLPMDAARVLKEKGVPVNPELVSSIAAGDPVAFALQAKLFGAAGKGVSAVTPEIVKDAFSKALQTASKVAPVAAGKALSKIGAASEAIGKIAEPIAKSAPVKFALAKFLGGPGAILQEGIEHAAKRLPGIGKAASGVGEEMDSGQIASPYAQALSDMASSAPNFAASVLSGAAFDAAMLGTTEGTPAEKESVAGIGTLFGALGGLHSAGQRLVGGQLIGRRFGSFTPAMTQKFLDVVAPGTEFKDFSVKDSNGNHNDAASQDAAKRWMISNGLAPDLAETNSKQAGATISLGGKTYAFSTVDRLTHEAVHAIQSTLPPEQQQRIRSYVRDRYSDAEWNQYKDYYANQLSRSATGKPLADGVSPNDYIKATTGTADVDSYINDEIQAEHLNTFLQHSGPELTPGKSLPELLARVAGKVIQGFGGNPLEGQMSTSPSVPLPLRQDIVSKLAGEIRPRITEEAKAAAEGLEETRKIASKHEGQVEKVKDWVNNQTTTPVVTPSGVTVKPTLAPDQAQAIKSLADATASGEEHDVEYWGAQGGPGTEIASMRPERRAEIEAQRSAKNEKRRPFTVRFLPRSVRATKKGAQFVGISSDVLQANVDKIAAWMTEVEKKSPGATKSLPYDLTTQTGRAEYEKDLRTYNENQSNGYTGSGLPLNVPTDVVTRTGGKIYAPEVKGKPISLEQAKADFINYTYNTQIPEGNSKVAPLHIAGQDISQATLPGRVVSPVSPRGEYTPEQLKAMKLDEISPRGVREVNPVRKQIEQIAQATVPKPSLIEAEVRLNHDRIISAKPVTSEAKTPVKGSNLLTREAGFEPNAKPEDEDLSKKLENLNDTGDQEKAKQAAAAFLKNRSAQFEPATDAGKEAEDRGFSFVHETDPETGTIRLALLNDLGKQVSLLDAAPDHQSNKMFHVDNVITDEAYRRQGLATVLYRELGALLQKKGVKVLGGLTVNDNPRGAREKVFGPPIREQKLESAQGPGYDFRKTFSAIKSNAQFEPKPIVGSTNEEGEVISKPVFGNLNQNFHEQMGKAEDYGNWRFVNGKLFWWHEPSEIREQSTLAHLEQKGHKNIKQVFLSDYDPGSKTFEKLYAEMHGFGKSQFEPASTAGASGEDPKLLARAQKAWADKGVKSPFFKKWFGKSKVVDSDGQPLGVFHGTTHDFDEFKHVRPNLENSFGAGHYFSTSEADVSDNYAGIGPDLTNRINRRAEQLLDLENVEYGSGDYDLTLKKAEAQARQELAGDNPHAITAYLKMENPAVLDPNGGTRLEYTYDENTGDETGTAIDLYQALLAEAPKLGADGQEIWNHVSMDGDLDGMTLHNVESKILESAMDASHPETGEYAANELVRRVFQHMGYDGVIVTDPATRYPGMGLSSDTKHYIVFNPEQIKGAENRGTFSPSDKRYNFEPASSFPTQTDAGNRLEKEGFKFATSGDLSGATIRVSKDDKPVGSILFSSTSGKYGELNEMFVEPEFRKQGIGEALMREAAQHLKDAGVTRIGGTFLNQVSFNLAHKVLKGFDFVDTLPGESASDVLSPEPTEDFGNHPFGSSVDASSDISKIKHFEPSKEDKDSLTLPVDNAPHSVTMATVPSIIENAVDDASNEKRPTQFEPSDKEELSNAVGAKTIRLVHLSSNPSLKYVDPAYLGKGKANPNDTRGAFKSYWFVRGSKLMGDENLLGLGGHHSYQSEISGEKIYDLRHNKPDPEGYFSRINREEADTELKRKGYDGLMVDTSDGRKVVMLYKKQPVKYVAPFKGSQAEPGVLDHPDFDKEVEKVRTGQAGGVTLKIDGSPYVWNPNDKRDVVTLKSFNVPQAQATPDQIRSLLSSQTDLLENPHIVAGLFAFSKDGKPTVSVDLNALVPQKFRKNTVNFARDNDQVAMWDPFGGPKGEGEEIRTGGEGNTRLNDLGEISDALAPLLKGEPVNVDEIKRQNADVGPKQEQGFFEGISGKEPLSSAQVGKMTKAEIAAHHPESIVPRTRDEKINYDITESPLYKQSGDESGAVKAFSRRLVSFAKEHLDRPEFKNGLKWYSEFVPMLKKVYGKSSETMAQLLAATSPRNSPTPNFALANDALEGFKSGRFNKKIQKYLDGVTKIESGQWEKWYNAQKKAGKLVNPRDNPTPEAFMAEWITAHDLQPRQSNGKLFGMHSTAVLQVLAGNWLTENTGPKTHQFVKNLLGLHHGATIDVWAARTMRRLGYDGFKPRWRILPGNETGVQDADFHFSQKAFAHAAKELGLTPDALQGGLWFAEKKLWADKGWGRLDLGDYRNEIKKVELLNAGIEQRLARHKAESKAKETQPLDLLSALPSR